MTLRAHARLAARALPIALAIGVLCGAARVAATAVRWLNGRRSNSVLR